MKTIKNLITEKSALMIKFVAFQIAMSFFGMMMFMSIYAINEAYMWLAGVFCIAFYASILGTAMWEDGQKDRIRVNGKRLKKNIFTGLLTCLVPYSVTIFISIAYAISSFIPSMKTLYSILNVIVKFLLSGVYVCFNTGVFGDNIGDDGVMFLLYTLITLLIGFVSYLLGLEGFFEKKDK